MSNTTAAPGTEPRAYHLRPESELIEAAKGTTDTARRERIERRAWDIYWREGTQGMKLEAKARFIREAITEAILFDAICEELI